MTTFIGKYIQIINCLLIAYVSVAKSEDGGCISSLNDYAEPLSEVKATPFMARTQVRSMIQSSQIQAA